ncbi:MAG TPA: SEC-C metal-binding domain-containing protein [Bryobacteraceae bacterium]|nr:SEC-C metal-binding domain-containing protein [Bryobacteraceae bacterium]
MDRIVERRRAADAGYRKQSAGKVLRSDARRLTDGELLAKLSSFGIELDRPSLERLCDRALSAEEIAQPLLAQCTFHGRREQMESDWIWICLSALWQRWFPNKPSFERLDDKMQAGYELRESGSVPVCRVWLEAWRDVLRILDKARIESVQDFDDRFGGSQALFNWMQDLESELWNAGLEDRQFLTARIALCKEGLRRFGTDGDLTTENRRRALAESHYELGETDKAEALYRDWLQLDPRWGWGWIGWSDCYRFTRTERRDWSRCEQILREGLSIADVRDRADIADRLADACEKQGRGEVAAAELRGQAARNATAVKVPQSVSSVGKVLRQKIQVNIGGPGLPLSEMSNLAATLRETTVPITRQKAGRNEPCPCGSGKKFKKCCGA